MKLTQELIDKIQEAMKHTNLKGEINWKDGDDIEVQVAGTFAKDKFIVLKVKRGISDRVSCPTDANINPNTHIIIAFKKLPLEEKAATAVNPKIIRPK